jgi:dTDP-4-amino-4,6-dideoxygalactose transaminase
VIDLPGDVWAEMSAVQARLGIIQCRRYPSIIAHRRAIAAIYLAALSVVGIVFGKLAEKTGVVGTIFKALKAVVDLLIGNLSHKK